MTVTEALAASEVKLTHRCLTEEEDHLVRSTKKIKSTSETIDETMDDHQSVEGAQPKGFLHLAPTDVSMSETGVSKLNGGNLNDANKGKSDQAKSFKQALCRSRFNENGNEKNFDYVEDISSDEEEAEHDLAKDEEAPADAVGGVPKVKIPIALLRKIREPWKKCLIVRLLGKKIGYKMFMAKMTRVWGLQADFEALDIGNGFSIVKFDMVEDYTRVYTGGP
ncbi:hypothetical protein ACSBR1_015188 [Camellia fascicularis]